MVLLAVLCGDPFCFQHFLLVGSSEHHGSTVNPLRTCHARLGTYVLVNFSLDQHHLGAFVADLSSLTFLAFLTSPAFQTFPASHVRLVLLGKIEEEQNGHQIGDVLQKAPFFEEAIPVRLGRVALGS